MMIRPLELLFPIEPPVLLTPVGARSQSSQAKRRRPVGDESSLTFTTPLVWNALLESYIELLRGSLIPGVLLDDQGI